MAFVCALTVSCLEKQCRVDDFQERKVMLLYSAGYNSLSSFLRDDIEDLKKGYIPGDRCSDDVLLVYSHLTSKNGNYTVPNRPALYRLSTSRDGVLVTDTLVAYPETTVSASAEQLSQVLTYVRDNFPAKSYGMVFSSHGYGYLPEGYYSNAKDYEASKFSARKFGSAYRGLNPVPYVAPDYDPSLPLTKSIGQDVRNTPEGRVSYEIDIKDFADAIPMKLDYLLFDACLMGGVEVAYQLRDVCGLLGFSQAEVLAEGLDYVKLTQRLLVPENPMPEAVCDDYYQQYAVRNGVNRSATISLVDCGRMDALVDVCAGLFDKYSKAIDALNPSDVQRFYRSSYHWFYDLESILLNAGITLEEKESLHQALDECVLYKASTESFMMDFDIDVFSGFSMFLPCNGGDRLKEYYKTLDWNMATGLVK